METLLGNTGTLTHNGDLRILLSDILGALIEYYSHGLTHLSHSEFVVVHMGALIEHSSHGLRDLSYLELL